MELSRRSSWVLSGAFAIIFDPTTLEALAVAKVLDLVDDLYERRIHVALDCKVVINDINQGSATIYCAIIRLIYEQSGFF